LDARLDRLRERLRNGDPDMTDEDLQAAITRAESKRAELAAVQTKSETAKVLSLLPKAAEAYRRHVVAGLDGHPEATAKARNMLRDLERLRNRRPPGQAVRQSEKCLSPFCLHASQYFEAAARAIRGYPHVVEILLCAVVLKSAGLCAGISSACDVPGLDACCG
jgi:hypothetical protein